MNKTLLLAIEMYQESQCQMRDVLEFGVYRGRTLRLLRENLDSTYRVLGFDTFEGLPEDWKGTSHRKGAMSAGGEIPNIPGVLCFKGLFSETIPLYLKDANDIAILHIDCDLYTSTVDVLTGCNSYIVKGTVIVFDEWYYNHNVNCDDHEQKAFYEWAFNYNREYELVDRIEDERQIVKISK